MKIVIMRMLFSILVCYTWFYFWVSYNGSIKTPWWLPMALIALLVIEILSDVALINNGKFDLLDSVLSVGLILSYLWALITCASLLK